VAGPEKEVQTRKKVFADTIVGAGPSRNSVSLFKMGRKKGLVERGCPDKKVRVKKACSPRGQMLLVTRDADRSPEREKERRGICRKVIEKA